MPHGYRLKAVSFIVAEQASAFLVKLNVKNIIFDDMDTRRLINRPCTTRLLVSENLRLLPGGHLFEP